MIVGVQATLLVLAGGSRRRMGRPKARLEGGEAAALSCAAAIPRAGRRPEPVCAAYRRSSLAAITAALDGGDLKAADIAARLDVTWLEGLDPDLFRSLNTVDDYERFNDGLAAQG